MLSRSAFIYEKVSGQLDQLVVFLGVICFGIFTLLYGFPLETGWQYVLEVSLYVIAVTFLFQEVLRVIFSPGILRHFIERRVEWFFLGLLSLTIFSESIVEYFFPGALAPKDLRNLAIGYLALTQLIIFFAQAVRIIRESRFSAKIEMTASRLMVVSFIVPILLGSLLLKLPNATVAGISWVDALFTATSAVCVTGLSVLDTSTAFTPLGKTIIALLLQIGGLGIMTITMSFGFLFASGLAVKERILFSELLAEDRLGRIGQLLLQVTFFTFVVELIGALSLYYALKGSFANFDINIFLNSVFHSISAFCNAGFSLFQNGLQNSLVKDNVLYSFVIMGLVLVGGLGYPIFNNIYHAFMDRWTKKRVSRTLLTSYTKLVLVATAILLLTGTALVYLVEGTNSFADLTLLEKIRQSLFLSVTSRTAGYDIWPTEALSIETCFILFFLMWVGGAPMSTAGGIKTVTLAIAWLNLTAAFRGAKKIYIFGREVAEESIHRSYAIVFGSILLIGLSSLLIIVLEPTQARLALVFEVVSAFSTAGLSRGLTGELSDAAKVLLTVLMFVGRLGFITVLNSFYRKYQPPRYRVLKENIPIV